MHGKQNKVVGQTQPITVFVVYVVFYINRMCKLTALIKKKSPFETFVSKFTFDTEIGCFST